MTNWTRKNLDALHFCIRQELKADLSLPQKIQLIAVKNAIAMTMSDPEGDLIRCRARICEVCREHEMHPCDLEAGWSPNCAFIRHHTL